MSETVSPWSTRDWKAVHNDRCTVVVYKRICVYVYSLVKFRSCEIFEWLSLGICSEQCSPVQKRRPPAAVYKLDHSPRANRLCYESNWLYRVCGFNSSSNPMIHGEMIPDLGYQRRGILYLRTRLYTSNPHPERIRFDRDAKLRMFQPKGNH